MLGLAATALLTMTTGCSALGSDDATATGGNASVEKAKITVAVVTAADLAPLYLADQNGYFKQEGLEVNFSVAASERRTTDTVVSMTC